MKENNKTKRNVIQIAHRLIREKGFDAVTISEICQEANISKNTFYYYFDSKESLLLEYFIIDLSGSEDIITEMITLQNPLEKYKLLSFRIVERLEEAGPEILKRLLMYNMSEKANFEFNKLSKEDKKKGKEIIQPYRDLRIKLLTQAQEEGLITSKVAPDKIEYYQLAITIGFAQMWATSNGAFSLLDQAKKAFNNLFEEISDK